MPDSVNTEIYKSIGQGNDPLKQPLAIMQLLGAVNQNKLFNQTYEARQNIGEAYKRNVDQSGKIDNRGLIRDIAGTGGFLAGEGVETAGSNATQQFSLDTTKLKTAQQIISSLASKKDLGLADIASAAVNLKRAGVDQDIIDGVLNDAYRAGNNPKALKKALTTQGIMSLGTGALGGEAGPPDESGVIPQIPTGEAIERRIGVVPGQDKSGMVTTNPPGFDTAAIGSASLFSNARARAANYGSDVFPMLEALPALERLGTQGTGPGTEELNTIKSFIQSNLSWLPGSDKIIGDPNKIKDFDEAKKYLTNMAGARAGAFGHGTDQALSTALTASPNTHISNLAATDLTKATVALRRMEQAQTLEADAKKVNPGNFATWAARWATDVDPRAFMVDLMTQPQLEKLNKTLKNPKERGKFNSSVKRAIDAGVITRPGGERTPGE